VAGKPTSRLTATGRAITAAHISGCGGARQALGDRIASSEALQATRLKNNSARRLVALRTSRPSQAGERRVERPPDPVVPHGPPGSLVIAGLGLKQSGATAGALADGLLAPPKTAAGLTYLIVALLVRVRIRTRPLQR
jgi:hypothetical protein